MGRLKNRAYYEAGADIIFIEAPQSIEDLRAIAPAFPNVPLFANMIEGGKTPVLSGQQLQELGFKIVVYPLSGLFAATKAMMDGLTHLRQQGTTACFTNLVSFREFEQLIDVPHYRQLEQQFTVSEASPQVEP